MELDPKTLSRLLSMSDAQLCRLISSIAADAGIDTSSLSLDPSQIGRVREALGSVTESDLATLGSLYQSYLEGREDPTSKRR